MYTYEILEDGKSYHILTHGVPTHYQYEPFIPYRGTTIEESATLHIEKIIETNNQVQMRVDALEEMINELLLGGL